jgi:cation diffusion facilitator CzcD-associated flavoprotein CzcO
MTFLRPTLCTPKQKYIKPCSLLHFNKPITKAEHFNSITMAVQVHAYEYRHIPHTTPEHVRKHLHMHRHHYCNDKKVPATIKTFP